MLSHLKKDDNSYDVFYQNLLEYTKVGERMKHIFIIKPDQNNKNIEAVNGIPTNAKTTKSS